MPPVWRKPLGRPTIQLKPNKPRRRAENKTNMKKNETNENTLFIAEWCYVEDSTDKADHADNLNEYYAL